MVLFPLSPIWLQLARARSSTGKSSPSDISAAIFRLSAGSMCMSLSRLLLNEMLPKFTIDSSLTTLVTVELPSSPSQSSCSLPPNVQNGAVKGPWTKEEDQKIIDCITQNITKWSEIAEHVEGRVGKQCRERWFNHLDPSLKKSSWTPAEDDILVSGQARYGNRSEIMRSVVVLGPSQR